MRFLKKKVSSALTAKPVVEQPKVQRLKRVPIEDEEAPKKAPKVSKGIYKFESVQPKKRAKANVGETLTPVKSLCTKNIVKNYGKAICNFCFMDASKYYLEDLIKKYGVSLQDFLDFLNSKKDSIDSIQSLKEMLIPYDDDSPALKAYKALYKDIGEIFIKYFSVNWIFNGRLTYKEAHLKFRYKMLRRLRNPEMFTHIKAFSKK